MLYLAKDLYHTALQKGHWHPAVHNKDSKLPPHVFANLSQTQAFALQQQRLLRDTGEGCNKYNDNPAQGTETSSGACISARKASVSTDRTNNSTRDRVSCDIHTEPTSSHNSN